MLVTSDLVGVSRKGIRYAGLLRQAGHSARFYTVIQARPTAVCSVCALPAAARADRNGANPMTPEEVHRVANERLMQMMPQAVLPSPDDGASGASADPATGLPAICGPLCRYQRNHRLRARIHAPPARAPGGYGGRAIAAVAPVIWLASIALLLSCPAG